MCKNAITHPRDQMHAKTVHVQNGAGARPPRGWQACVHNAAQTARERRRGSAPSWAARTCPTPEHQLQRTITMTSFCWQPNRIGGDALPAVVAHAEVADGHGDAALGGCLVERHRLAVVHRAAVALCVAPVVRVCVA